MRRIRNMPYGYNGRILRVDLANGRLLVEEPSEKMYRDYMGGGMGIYYLLTECPARTDPLGPDNVLTLFTGVLTGAPIHGQSRVMAFAKSPLTGSVGASEGGGFWPAECKAAGFDGIVITGAAKKPVYLWINDGEAELRDAMHLWGKETGEVEDLIREELKDDRIEVLQVGPAGEKQVRFASILSMANRACGRTGMGAVMGSKKLKAIAVRGHKHPEIFEKQALSEIAKWGSDQKDDKMAGLMRYGTASGVKILQGIGSLPTRNFSAGVFEGVDDISGERMRETLFKRDDTCYACGIRCKRVVECTDGVNVDPRYGGPEYETIGLLGSNCGVNDLKFIAKANEICNRFGLDTISAGGCVAFAMDLYENGILTKEDTGGLDLHFGNGPAMCALVEQIAKREGLGDLLAEGTDIAAERIGRGAKKYSVAVRNYGFPAHMPEAKRAMGLFYVVHPTGADHNAMEHDDGYLSGWEAARLRQESFGLRDNQDDLHVLNPEKVRFVLYNQHWLSAVDSVGACSFVWGFGWGLYMPSQLVEAVGAATGWNVTLWELMKAGERRINLMQVFNAREGVARGDSRLPARCYQPKVGGVTDGVAVQEGQIETAVSQYFAMANWSSEGVPTKGKLLELGVDWAHELLA
jgi:aldehyde:ferredoxin oxidoreductase